MIQKYIAVTLIIMFWLNQITFAQHPVVKKDSADVYRKIEEFSKKKRITKFVYDLFFIPVSPVIPAQKKKKLKKQPKIIVPNYEGKIIRSINITTLDPFGTTINGGNAALKNILYKAGNSLHIRTQHITIRDLLLIHKNKPFDSLLAKESERLIRAQIYVHEVSVIVQSTSIKSDSVDIYIRVMDTWSVVPNGAVSGTNFSIYLEEKNFLGLGHDFQNNFSSNNFKGKNTYKTNYLIPNIRNTYISAAFHYERDEKNNFSNSLSVDRPFFSPFAKWAAGIYAGHQFRNELIKIADSVYLPQKIKLNTQDCWAGYALQIFKGNTENARTTNLTAAGRFARTHYIEKLDAVYDTLNIYADEDLYLAMIGIATRKYVQDKYIFKYGITEDVPVGMVYSLTCGYRVKNNSGQIYLGGRASFGNFNKFGYLSTFCEYGTFLRPGHTEQGVISAGINYFTELLEIGGVKIRQFIKPQYTIGIYRLPNENLNINNGNGIQGFNSSKLTGTQKLILTLQTQFYLPWRLLGFRFGPYFVYSFGMLGNDVSGFKKSRVYSQAGLGLLVNNEFLVLNTFQVSIAFYPSIPGIGNNILKMNPDKSTDFGFRDFDIGKPAEVSYQ